MQHNQEYMDLLGVSASFTVNVLKKHYRDQAKIHHPDVGGNENTFKKLNEAFNKLLPLAMDGNNGTVATYNGYTGTKIKTVNGSQRMFQSCDFCKGQGHTIETCDRSIMKECPECKGWGYVTLNCNRCDKGVFTLKNGRKVECRSCKGTGIFRRSVRCRKCSSFGWIFGREEVGTSKMTCGKCEGAGETDITPFNPLFMPSSLV